MLWKVKLQWPLIEAASKTDAYEQVVKMLKDNPKGFITGIEDARLGSGGFVKRLFTGR
jgi:hypothetical protein